MLIEPPIDKLIEKVECKYTLCCMVAKRARMLQDKMPRVLEEADMKPISYAAMEIYEGKIKGTNG